MEFIRKVDYTDYLADQTVTIGSGGGSDIVEDVPTVVGLKAYEFLIEGRRVVLLGYDTQG